jgi:NAD(P)-dependent dehydrogenase (short-subunit alcohol dehydrogenase family)
MDDLQWKKRPYKGTRVYATSLLLEILFTYELARRLDGTGVTANCLHPGVVATDLARHAPGWLKPLVKVANLFFVSPEKGARTQVYLAGSPEVEGATGRYFINRKAKETAPITHDRELARRLWDISSELCGLTKPDA